MGVFAPAQDLANHPLQAGKGRTPLQPGLLQPADHLKRLQQANVEIRGEQGVPHGGLAADHGVLERAEAIEPRIDEMLQHRQRLGAGNCPPKRRTNPWQARFRGGLKLLSQLVHLGNHGPGDCIRRKDQWFRPHQPLGRCLAILLVVVPLSTKRLAVIAHQHAKTLAALPVEQFHAQLLVGSSPGAEIIPAPEKSIGEMPHQWRRQGQPFNRFTKGALCWLHQMQLADLVLGQPILQRLSKGWGLQQVHRPAPLAQLGSEMPHGTPHQHQLLAVIVALLQHRAALNQQYPGSCGGVGCQSCLEGVQLVAQHPDANHAQASPASRQARRATAAA